MPEKMLHTAARMTVAGYAKHRGCSRRAVYDAIRAGRIPRLPDGTIDVREADRAWKANTSHVGGVRRGRSPKSKPRRRLPLLPQGVAAGEAEARRLLRRGTAEVLSFADARRARELVKLAREALELRRLECDTFDRGQVAHYVTREIRRARDAFLTIPARQAAQGAAELGLDEGRLYRWLTRTIRAFLEEQSRKPAADEDERDEDAGV